MDPLFVRTHRPGAYVKPARGQAPTNWHRPLGGSCTSRVLYETSCTEGREDLSLSLPRGNAFANLEALTFADFWLRHR